MWKHLIYSSNLYLLMLRGVEFYVKHLSENEKIALRKRFEKIKYLQEKGTCFSCDNFSTGDIFHTYIKSIRCNN